MNPDLLAAVMGRVQQKRAGAGKPNLGFMAGNGGVGQNPPSFGGVPGLVPPPQIAGPKSGPGASLGADGGRPPVPGTGADLPRYSDPGPTPGMPRRGAEVAPNRGTGFAFPHPEPEHGPPQRMRMTPDVVRQFLSAKNPQAWRELWRSLYESRNGSAGGGDGDWLRSQLIRKSIGRRPMSTGKGPRVNGKSQALRGY